jgi:hypothetical protein
MSDFVLIKKGNGTGHVIRISHIRNIYFSTDRDCTVIELITHHISKEKFFTSLTPTEIYELINEAKSKKE